MRIIALIFCLLMTRLAGAAVLGVPGSYATGALAEAAALPGDTILFTGPYTNDSTWTIDVDGNSSNWINIMSNTNAGKVVLRKIAFSGANYIRVIANEFDHNGSEAYSQGISFAGVCSNIQIVDNYIHGIRYDGIQFLAGSVPSDIVMRGNRIDYVGYPGDVSGNAMSGVYITPHRILFEYNVVTRVCDMFNMFGTNIICRNNNYSWVHADLFGTLGHPDTFQPSSDGAVTGTKHHIYERNLSARSTNDHSHWAIFQDRNNAEDTGPGDTNLMVRGNIAYYIGSSGLANIGTDKMRVLNNTAHYMSFFGSGGVSLFIAYATGSGYTGLGQILVNNVIHDDQLSTDAIYLEEASYPTLDAHNWGYLAGSEASYVGTTDPLFVSTTDATIDLRLTASSPLRGAGTNVIWSTTNTTATSFHVNDAQLLCDGWGIVEGDVVVIGNTTTRITAVNWTNNVITVATEVTVTNTQPVWWGRLGNQKDIGAFPFGAQPLTAATITQSGTTYTVTPVGDARGVWFYVDGIPTTWDYDAPYEQTFASGTVTAKAYAEWAQLDPVVTCVGVSGSTYRDRGRATRAGGILP